MLVDEPRLDRVSRSPPPVQTCISRLDHVHLVVQLADLHLAVLEASLGQLELAVKLTKIELARKRADLS